MSEQNPAAEPNPSQPIEQPPQEDVITPEQQEAYDKMMSTLSNMNNKIQKVKSRLAQPTYEKKEKTDEITNKLIQSKESSEIITKENLLTDITESYEKVVIEVYSENGKLKKKVEQMAKIIKDQNNKLYTHTQREKDLLNENEQLRSQIAKLKDEKLMIARGHVPNQAAQRQTQKQETSSKKKPNQTASNQNQDFDFWSMPQNDYGKKKKDFVQDSNLWVNQKQVQESVFLTQQQGSSSKKKK